jgi:hypothetical protein
MPERVFEGQAEGPSRIMSDRGELKDTEVRRQIIMLLETDPETQKRFKESGKTAEEFIADYVKYFGKDALKNLTDLGFKTIMEERNKRPNK